MNRARLRTLLLATTGLTYVLLLLGIYTAAAGAGLTCDARWPLCDGAVFGLFPANWPSFIEWFHRLVAMIAGFLVIGTAYGAWRWQDDRRVRLGVTTALVLYPVQALLGAGTVLDYTFLYLTAHFVTALAILASLVLATLWYLGPRAASLRRLRYALLGVVGLYPPLLVLSPGAFVTHTATVQAIYYAVGLAIFVASLAAAAWAGLLRSPTERLQRVRLLAAVAAVLVGVQLLLGRYLYTELIRLLDATLMVTVLLLVGVAAWLTYRVDPAGAAAGSTTQ